MDKALHQGDFITKEVNRILEQYERENKNLQKQARDELPTILECLVEYWEQNHTDLMNIHNQFDHNMLDYALQPEREPKYFDSIDGYKSVVVLTANNIEHLVVTKLLFDECGEKIKTYITSDDKFMYHFTRIKGVNVVHFMQQDTSANTKRGSYDAVEAAVERFHPKMVVSLGVAFGIDPCEQQMGDVLISDSVLSYTDKMKFINGRFILGNPTKYEMSDFLKSQWKIFFDMHNMPGLNENFNWSYGPMLSGGAVVNDFFVKERLLAAAEGKVKSRIIGGEMEGSGLIKICEKNDIPYVVIKGICDWGACKNSWNEIIEILPYELTDVIPVVTGQEEQIKVKRNDFVKDAIQMTAASNAFKVLAYLLEYSEKMINEEVAWHKGGLFKIQLDRLKQCRERFARDNFDFLTALVPVILVAVVCILWGSEIIKLLKELTPICWAIAAVFLALLFVLVRFFLFCLHEKHTYPDDCFPEAAHIQISNIDFARGNCVIKNASADKIESVIITWQNRKRNVRTPGKKTDVLRAGFKIDENVYADCDGKKPPRVIIRFDTLQIDYKYRGNSFCHTVIRKPFSEYFTETVYMKEFERQRYLYRIVFRETA